MTEIAVKSVTVALPTLGCKVNRYDSDALARALISRGYVIVPPGEMADVYIVNTCTVTNEAEVKSRKTLRRALRINQEALLIVTGCYATLESEELAAIDGVDVVVPITEQETIPELVAKLRPTEPLELPLPSGLSASIERTRATVKVEDGCNLRCAFCAVTLARGPVRSRRPQEVVEELRGLVRAGMREIVLTGIRLDAYGKDQGSNLSELLDITRHLGIARLRLSSLEPIGIDDTLVRSLAAHPALCHHFHICLQSGDDGVLRAMRRGYTTERYRRIIAKLRAAMPDAAFTTDIIVGYPGETDEAFRHTLDFVREIGFIKLHIFKYSPRPGTAAADLPDQIPEAVKEERRRALFALEQEIFRAYAEGLIGQTVEVLVEQTGPHGDGLTPHYLRVCADFPEESAGWIVPVRVTGAGDDCIFGEM
ncbi:MAG: tRNA (N(6)-L-threonylcarbamoyladenosine(37)-C(2))-methylthiotransferase MtaB [Armatimonadota bacterium]